MVRKHCVFEGRVQGVGFRFTVQRMALQLKLTGWVKNLYDGRVEACFQGEEDRILQLIAHMESIRYIRIEASEVEEVEVVADEVSFQIKY